MKKFLALPADKKTTIIDAAMKIFGAVGYKKASAKDIADAAGISKGMIFHYFGSKQKLYLYLVDLSFEEIITTFTEKVTKEIDDFFDRIKFGTEVKLSILKKHPALMEFLTSVYLETDSEVKSEINKRLKDSESFRDELVLTDLGVEKFKESVDPKLVLEILIKFSEGYVSSISHGESLDIDKLVEKFNACLLMMKNNFYKEEYL